MGRSTCPPCVCPARVKLTRSGISGNRSGLCMSTSTGPASSIFAIVCSKPFPRVHRSASPASQKDFPRYMIGTLSFSSTRTPRDSRARRTRGPSNHQSWFPNTATIPRGARNPASAFSNGFRRYETPPKHSANDHIAEDDDQIRLLCVGDGDHVLESGQIQVWRAHMKIGHHCDLEPGVLLMPRPDWDYLMHDCQAGWFPPKCPESQKEKNRDRDAERLLDSPEARRPKDGFLVFRNLHLRCSCHETPYES